jgi:hypothetical protein
MKRPGRSILLRFFPSMTDVAFVMPLVFLFGGMKGTQTLLGDGDTGWHLRTGQWILEHGRVPDRDIFSFTRSGQPWFAWEWLWDVIFGWLHLRGGMAAVLVASSLVLALTFALLFRLARWKSGDALAALVITLIAAAGSAGHWLARPHLFTMLFTVLFYGILERTGQSGCQGTWARRGLWLLPPLMLLWANLHGGFVAGLIVVASYAAAEFAVMLRDTAGEERRAALQRGRLYALVAAACAMASFVNPYGYRLHRHIFAYLSDGFFRGNIMEFQSLNFQSGQAPYFEILLLLGAAAAFQCVRRGRLAWPLLFAAWAHLSLSSARHVEIYVILAAPQAAESLVKGFRRAAAVRWADWLGRGLRAFRELSSELSAFDGAPRWHLASAAALILLATVFYAPQPPAGYRPEYDPKSYPAAAAGLLERAGVFGGVFTMDLWGGYLIYRQYPRARVFMDGRSDFYGKDFAQKYIEAMGVRAGWERFLQRYGVDTILLPPNAPLAGALKQSSAWHLLYDDGVAQIFRSVRATALQLEPVSPDPSGSGTKTATTSYPREKRL